MTGMITGGWEFVIAGYVLTGFVFSVYTFSLVMRYLAERDRAIPNVGEQDV